jgi:hypothetical protein
MKRRISINSGSVVPQSFITKSKQRLKQHVDTVYLNNGDEFEIELFNPTQNKVLAKIELNGNSIGSGIILRPGERVFLERYLDDTKKFLFETYTVNRENDDVLNAIKNNGDVTVKFYKELTPLRDYSWVTTNIFNQSGTGGFVTPTTTIGNNFYNASLNNTLGYSTDIFIPSVSGEKTMNMSTSVTSEVETGRVEKGSHSNQSFTYDYSSFESQPSWNNWWSIKPISQKPVVKEDLVTYCTECGGKRKKDNHKFCPHCGTKY